MRETWLQSLGREEPLENGNLLQHSFLENPMDRGAWQTTVYGVAKNWTWLSNWVYAHTHTHTHTHTYTGLVAPLHVGSSWIRDQPIPCTGGQILNHWTTRDTLEFLCKYNHTLCCPFKLGPSVAKLCPTLCDPMASLMHCNYSSFFLSVAE